MAEARGVEDPSGARPGATPSTAGFGVVERARESIARHGLVRGGESVLVAVSGGPDSTCLLDVLGRLSSPLELELSVAHVDHGLGGSSAEVAARVTGRAATSGYEVHTTRAPDLDGPNLHARARAFRYAFFETIADRLGGALIATGHTLDDQVETTVGRLIHGAGTAGLAGIPPREAGRIRPLIDVRRRETRAYCEQRGLEFFDDPANIDARFDRSEVRHRLLAPIEERWGDGAIRAMAQSAAKLRDDAVALEALADRLFESLAVRSPGTISFGLDKLEVVPRALRRRLIEHAVGRVRDRAGGIEAALDALERGHKPDARFAVAGGVEISVTRDALVVEVPGTVDDDASSGLESPPV